MRSLKKRKKLIIISGGTMSDIRPHLSLCAPAFGTVGKQIKKRCDANTRLFNGIDVHLELTKMAGGKLLNTVDNVRGYVRSMLKDEEVIGIVMAAAICDFKAERIEGLPHDGIGRDKSRIKTKRHDGNDQHMYVFMSPEEKIISEVKKIRPDIVLVGFKTVSDVSSQELLDATKKAKLDTGADIVIGNDIAKRMNAVNLTDGRGVDGTRELILDLMCIELGNLLNKRYRLDS